MKDSPAFHVDYITTDLVLCVCVYIYIIQAVYLFHSVLFCLMMFAKHIEPYNIGIWCYWVVQVGWLTPLTITRHGLNPLAVFTSGTYFLHNGMRWQ